MAWRVVVWGLELHLDKVDLGIARNLTVLNPEALGVELLQNHSMPWIGDFDLQLPWRLHIAYRNRPCLGEGAMRDPRSEIRPPKETCNVILASCSLSLGLA